MTASKVPSARERADVQLVEHELLERQRRTAFDLEAGRVDDPRRAADPLRLVARARIGQRLRTVEHEHVVVTGRPVDDTRVHPLSDRLELLVRPTYAHGHGGCVRRPHAELHTALR